MTKTKIEWADMSWNPFAGCGPMTLSAGCVNCYAEKMAWRLKCMGLAKYQDVVDPDGWTGRVVIDEIELARRFPRTPTRIFVNSMSDTFHAAVSDDWILSVMISAARTRGQGHTFLFLTKRADRMHKTVTTFIDNGVTFHEGCTGRLPNFFWLGVTAESQLMAAKRLPWLCATPAARRFVSVEPMLGPVDLREWLPDLDLVICGGESGPNARPMHPEWVRNLRDQCIAANVPFFFKQWGEWGTAFYDMRTGEPRFQMFDTFERWVNKARSWLTDKSGRLCVDQQGRVLVRGGDFQNAAYPVAIMDRVGKKNAGRMLDGRVWDQWPEVNR